MSRKQSGKSEPTISNDSRENGLLLLFLSQQGLRKLSGTWLAFSVALMEGFFATYSFVVALHLVALLWDRPMAEALDSVMNWHPTPI
mmetsp:Transcript_5161/g.8497  ORF Transcript_5161/g.8497 Transcript_5161/m.8497 type:complete len:87 (+) Transcript_5161:49-309(+)